MNSDLYKRLWKIIPRRNKLRLLTILLFTLITALFESATISLYMPLIKFLSSSDANFYIGEIYIFRPVLDGYKVNVRDFFLLFSTFTIITALFRIKSLQMISDLAFRIGKELSKKVFSNYIHENFNSHNKRNTGEGIDLITSKIELTIYSTLLPIITLINSTILLILMFLSLLFLAAKATILLFLTFGIIYFAVILFVKAKIKILSKNISDALTSSIITVQEALGAFRYIKLFNMHDLYTTRFQNDVNMLRDSQYKIQVLGQSPRYIMEAAGVLVIWSVGFILSASKDINFDLLGVLGLIAVGAQRMLPILQQIYNSWSNISASNIPCMQVVSEVERNVHVINDRTRIEFKSQINFNNVCYSSNKNNFKLKDINIEINKGDRIGLIGKSGSGKSTLLDILMGFLTPDSGSLSVDGVVIDNQNSRQLQNIISLVPQNVFISEGTIIKNIAFSDNCSTSDIEIILKICEIAVLSELVCSLDLGLMAYISENGGNISGGQKQRIGLARALFRDSQVLLLDECTSALDKYTESKVIDNIYNLSSDYTIIIVTHNKEILYGCNKIYEISNGNVIQHT